MSSDSETETKPEKKVTKPEKKVELYTFEQRKASYMNLRKKKMTWGKHKGETFSKILKTDGKYLTYTLEKSKEYFKIEVLNSLEMIFNMPLTPITKKDEEENDVYWFCVDMDNRFGLKNEENESDSE